jgi:23S rRNA U2552 (ribose-2'-O)-methylase RlmE/FtsJ
MQYFEIKNNIKERILPFNNNSYVINKCKDLKELLNQAKNKLGDNWNNRIFVKFWSEFDPFYIYKQGIAELIKIPSVTNATLKMFEMLAKIPDLINCESIKNKTNLNQTNKTNLNQTDKTNLNQTNKTNLNQTKQDNYIDVSESEIITFDNAAFPGAFIISITHYISTYFPVIKHQWYASSLIDDTKNRLKDIYRLYELYPDHWLMNKDYNGDVTKKINIKHFNNILPGTVDLYTSDLGFDVTNSYDRQEQLHYYPNVGQALSGLFTLRKGGSFITKQFTMLESYTISLMYVISTFFEEMAICKPVTSRAANSEVYVVCKKFIGGVHFNHPYIKALLQQLDKYNEDNNLKPIALFHPKDYPKNFIINMLQINKTLAENQITVIDNNCDTILSIIKKHNLFNWVNVKQSIYNNRHNNQRNNNQRNKNHYDDKNEQKNNSILLQYNLKSIYDSNRQIVLEWLVETNILPCISTKVIY